MQAHRKPTSGPGRRPARPLVSVPLALVMVLGACTDASEPAPDADWPPGALLSARRDAAAHWLKQLARLEGTPLAREAGAWLDALPDCPELEARAAQADGLLAALRCAAPDPALPGLRRHRGEADLALALPRSDGPRVLVTGQRRDGTTRLSVHWPRPADSAPAAGLLPGEGAAGPPVLQPGERVFHARVRSDGLDLAALAPAGSQADELFRLRSRLLSSALLDGTWELAIYPPPPGEEMPRVAAALGVRSELAARTASERFLDDVESTWPLHRQPFTLGSRQGACLPDLNLLPQLAPCLLATDGALVLGWNAESLRHALASASASASDEPTRDRADPADHAAPGRLVIDFARLREADHGLAARHGDAALHQVTRWPWQRLEASGRRDGDALTLQIEAVERDS